VQVRTNARADRLVLDGDRVAGVVVNGAALDAATGVVLATGGYSPDVQLRSLWLGRMIDFSCELESNSGDGHRMGLAAGADLGGMGDAWWMPHIPVGVENAVVNSAGSREDRMLPHTMMVDATGRRFMNEALNYHDAGETFPVRGGAIQHYPAWLLFDQEGVERYAILTWKVEGSRQAGADWYHSAATVAELAPQLGIEPAVLTRSVERFNGFARSGVDEDFRRGENPWDLAWGDPACTPNPCLAPLDRGPFHAVRVHPGALSTRGGLRVDDRGRVLGVTDGQPIAGLFAVGNCSNAGPAGAYPGPGATLGAALTFGYLAGQAAAETHASLRP
jgi:3-oxosteroid 1-dehydrogenase